MIYLDHNSTTPIDPTVADAIRNGHAAGYLNPASQHRLGQTARRQLELTRVEIATHLGALTTGMQTDSLIFTSGGTESNNLAVIGLATAVQGSQSKTGQVLISAVEHPSVMGAGEQLARMGFIVRKIPVNQSGVCDLTALRELLTEPTLLVSMMLVNHETGVLQPVAEATKICHDNGTLIHTDAVQAVGKIPVDFRGLGVDALTFTAHKFNGPRGIGGLLLRQGVAPQPILFGGFQQMAIRPGTEDVALAIGMNTALNLWVTQPDRMTQVGQLRDHLQSELTTQISDTVVIGGESKRVPTTLNIAFPGIDRQSFLLAADIEGIAVSTGSACESGSSELSPVLTAMSLPKKVIESAIRISLGVSNSPTEITTAGRTFRQLVTQLKSI